MRKSWSSKPTAGRQGPQNSVMQMHARRVLAKNTRTPKKSTTRPPIPRNENPPASSTVVNRDITIAYARCLEMMMTAPMAQESEKWRETIIKSKPNRTATLKSSLKKPPERVNENVEQGVIEEIAC